jgi:alkylation response protein AidB-like acyl-CoA dehydrogenase
MMRFPMSTLTDEEIALGAEVRAYLEQRLPVGTFERALGMAGDADPEFSRELGQRGWLGMSLPREYGGGGGTAVQRFVVVEQLLRWGAPVGHHWIADRQSGPSINRFGTPSQRERFLPLICAGEVCFAIGMSEPDSGSDLSSLRTNAVRTEGGWRVSGTKVWTSGASRCDWLIVLARTSVESRAQEGLSQFLVDSTSPGLTIRPIAFIDGTYDFAEVTFDDVFVPDDLVLGEVGGGWGQNTAELALERGGPDRWLSSYGLLEQWLSSGGADDDPAAHEFLGRAVSAYWTLRGLSLSVARMVDNGLTPVTEAALVKEMGTRFEQDIVTAIVDFYDRPVSTNSSIAFERTLARAQLTAPSFTVRGGTNEVLRNVVSRSLVPSRPT